MHQIPVEVTAMIRITSLGCVFVTNTVLIAGGWWQRTNRFRNIMLGQWKPALVIAVGLCIRQARV